MKYRQWKKNYKKMHGVNPPITLDKRKQIKFAKKLIHIEFPAYVSKFFYHVSMIFKNMGDTLQTMYPEIKLNDGGWIACDKDNLPDKEVLCCDKYGEMILGYIAEDEGSETGFCAENDNEYMYDCVKWMEKPKP